MKRLFTFFTFALLFMWCLTITSCGKDEETQLPDTEQGESDEETETETETETELPDGDGDEDENVDGDADSDENEEENEDNSTPEPDSNTALISQIIWDDIVATFEYDDQNRLIKYTQSDDEETASMTYTYDEESKITGTSNYVSVYETTKYNFEILLNSDNTPSKMTVIESGQEYVMCEFSYYNGVLSSCNDYLGSSSYTNIACTWSDGNMVTMGDDKFQYSSMDNNYSIDLNMFITNSEELSLLSDTFGFIKSIDGIHSKNMISQCTEEGCTYNIVYTTDSEGRITSAKWDKYGNGKEYGFDNVKYY